MYFTFCGGICTMYFTILHNVIDICLVFNGLHRSCGLGVVNIEPASASRS
jgi:hypothetical protein